MTREEFNAAMERILVFYQKPTSPDAIEDFQSYMRGLFEAVRIMEPALFDATCRELVQSLARGQKPMPSQFWAVYHRLSVGQAQKSQGPMRPMTFEENHLWMLQEASRMSPRGAAWVLDQMTERGMALPNDVIEALVDRSTQETRVLEPTEISSTAT